jgi:signal transduction histidine kinase
LGRDWRFTYLNRCAESQMRRLGKDPAKLIGKLLWDEFNQVPNAAALHRVMYDRVAVTDDLYYAPLGEWVENHMYPTDGGGLLVFQRYVTARKRNEAALRRSAALLAMGEEISHTGSWSWNAADGELFWSPEHFRIFGFDVDDKAPPVQEAMRRLHADDGPRWEEAFYRAVREKADFDVEGRVVHPGGTIRHVRSRGRPALDEGDRVREYLGIIMDTTEQKQAEEKLVASERRLAEARAELAHVNRVLTVAELTGSIAHEINQPLAAIRINANACERWLAAAIPDIAEASESLRRISRDAKRASDVINRIRGLLTRRPSHKSELRIEEVIRDVSLLVQREAQANNVQMRVQAPAALPAIVADRVQLQQVILNLVVNAIEAMSAVEAPRRLDLRAEPYGDDDVLVAVRDSGVGLDPQLVDRIYEPFFTTKVEGMGMGLAISRSIVEAHGGRFWATNNAGGGATFQFTLPARGA